MADQLFDSSGNPRVDFVWGNLAPQPDYGRDDNWTSFGGGSGDYGWDSTYYINSDVLDTTYTKYPIQAGENSPGYDVPNNHETLLMGWSNFPEFIPNYEGDGDVELEAVVPEIMRKTLAQAEYALDKVGLDLFAVAHNPDIYGIVSDGTTIRIYAYDGSAYGDSALVGLRAGDKVWIDNSEYDFGDVMTITKVNDDGEDSWIEFEYTAEPVTFDTEATGTIWAGPDLTDVITVVRFWNAEGSIKDTGTNIHVRYLGD